MPGGCGRRSVSKGSRGLVIRSLSATAVRPALDRHGPPQWAGELGASAVGGRAGGGRRAPAHGDHVGEPGYSGPRAKRRSRRQGEGLMKGIVLAGMLYRVRRGGGCPNTTSA